MALDGEARLGLQAKQGRAVFGVDMKIVDGDGKELPRDGKVSGELLVRGPWIIANYFKGEGGDPLVDGWFPTGDVSTIDADGFMQITDRAKDVIKSGGEWIGSIDLENIAMSHPAVAMAACIGARHPKWDERPLLVVMKKPNAEVSREECSRSSRARSPSGGRPTTWCSSTASRWAPPARCRRTSCARVQGLSPADRLRRRTAGRRSGRLGSRPRSSPAGLRAGVP